ncbi:hypothetical protein FS749_004478 [Ceratobasidium sp. UAMH 11750]|nr:hypothetical protein FS749_004478 [Ceratobasidium sp. UAMH 11750]
MQGGAQSVGEESRATKAVRARRGTDGMKLTRAFLPAHPHVSNAAATTPRMPGLTFLSRDTSPPSQQRRANLINDSMTPPFVRYFYCPTDCFSQPPHTFRPLQPTIDGLPTPSFSPSTNDR